MKRPPVVLIGINPTYQDGDPMVPLCDVSNERLLLELRCDPPEFIADAVEAELLLRLEAWAKGSAR